MGVSLPKEHLDFFKRNMRIGLAHPKASKTRRSSESHAAARPFGFSNDDSESEYSGSDSDSESDLSDELARLDLDDIDWMSSSASSGLRRSRTVAGGQQQSVRRRAKQPRRQRSDGWSTLPDEPGWSSHRAPLLQRQFSGGTASSYGSLSSTPRPSTFQQSQAPTASPIRENVQEGGVQDDTDGTLRASDRARARRHLQQQHQEMLHGNLFDSSDPFSVTSSAATHGRAKGASKGRKSGNEHPAHVRSRSDDLAAADRQSTGTGRGTGAGTLQQNAPVPPPAGADDTFAMVSFNSLPNKAQYLILKCVAGLLGSSCADVRDTREKLMLYYSVPYSQRADTCQFVRVHFGRPHVTSCTRGRYVAGRTSQPALSRAAREPLWRWPACVGRPRQAADHDFRSVAGCTCAAERQK